MFELDQEKTQNLKSPAREYVDRLESLLGVPFKYISVGLGREQTFIK